MATAPSLTDVSQLELRRAATHSDFVYKCFILDYSTGYQNRMNMTSSKGMVLVTIIDMNIETNDLNVVESPNIYSSAVS